MRNCKHRLPPSDLTEAESREGTFSQENKLCIYTIVYRQNRLAIEPRMSKAFHRTSYCTYLQCPYIGMYVCASLCACPCLCVAVCGCVYSCLHVPASTYVNVYVLTLRRHACIRVTYVRTYVSVCMYALFMPVCMYACMHVCMSAYMPYACLR